MEPGEVTKTFRGKEEFVPRRLRIKKEDLEKFGFTTGCPGCRAANRGTTAVGHAEECRKRITEELTKLGDERTTREHERWFVYLTEEENMRKRSREEADGAVRSRWSRTAAGGVV